MEIIFPLISMDDIKAIFDAITGIFLKLFDFLWESETPKTETPADPEANLPG